VARLLGITFFFTDQTDSSSFLAVSAEGQDTSWSTLAKLSQIQQNFMGFNQLLYSLKAHGSLLYPALHVLVKINLLVVLQKSTDFLGFLCFN